MSEQIKALVELLMWVEAKISVERERSKHIDCAEREWQKVRDHLQKKILIVTKKECCEALGKSSLKILAENRKSIKSGE